MAGWTRHKGQAVALPIDNIDTDQLIPARFMSTPRSEGYGRFLLHDQDAARAALDAAPGASILIAGRNFGSGSSREAAVYALADAGFRAVIAPSFGDIFAGNAVNNGLCPARVEDIAPLLRALETGDKAEIDLEAQIVTLGDTAVPFDIAPVWKTKLINGWDDIDMTRAYDTQIAAFAAARPHWTQPKTEPRAGSGADT
ncbi:3-isopropylmalate dehydratase small subunit [Aestuariicoccus sp. MJ-SS9]|uniref:3-isopropylmalate dehydratase small subunit n=1 Tax=Aestuariicoccus sp. MJ-SS9 TaxID=3079855 RepID=UPI0029142672|nr:3-isopropylmalate dehydratase small subunit [Aestuariicoccus sp. MJ-SS9]MDU8910647.1 3-isopropylmalate dehydratase small subunit [Aestuariicoccus sp. MJ-SS9]